MTDRRVSGEREFTLASLAIFRKVESICHFRRTYFAMALHSGVQICMT